MPPAASSSGPSPTRLASRPPSSRSRCCRARRSSPSPPSPPRASPSSSPPSPCSSAWAAPSPCFRRRPCACTVRAAPPSTRSCSPPLAAPPCSGQSHPTRCCSAAATLSSSPSSASAPLAPPLSPSRRSSWAQSGRGVYAASDAVRGRLRLETGARGPAGGRRSRDEAGLCACEGGSAERGRERRSRRPSSRDRASLWVRRVGVLLPPARSAPPAVCRLQA
mmetsp:Transcript_13508/g.43178  ORF Transcript_13508/g.43178 Transcript_13508/m.43178 type:complete len:221 (-) Transcript_13508:144-806(-)